MDQVLWSAQVHDGTSGRYVSASLSRTDGGALELAFGGVGEARSFGVDRDDAVSLFEALDDALGPDNG